MIDIVFFFFSKSSFFGSGDEKKKFIIPVYHQFMERMFLSLKIIAMELVLLAYDKAFGADLEREQSMRHLLFYKTFRCGSD